MLKKIHLATLTFSGVQAVDLSSAAQIEIGSTAMNDPSVVEAMLAQIGPSVSDCSKMHGITRGLKACSGFG